MEYYCIANEEEYEAVTQRIERLEDAEPGTAEAKELKTLIKALIAYEHKQVHALVRNK